MFLDAPLCRLDLAPLPNLPPWTEEAALVGITLQVQPLRDSTLYPQYTIGLHAWFLHQIQQRAPRKICQEES